MKLPVHFYKPLAIGAPQPLRELPVRPERMIHFFPPHIEKIRAKAPETEAHCRDDDRIPCPTIRPATPPLFGTNGFPSIRLLLIPKTPVVPIRAQ